MSAESMSQSLWKLLCQAKEKGRVLKVVPFKTMSSRASGWDFWKLCHWLRSYWSRVGALPGAKADTENGAQHHWKPETTPAGKAWGAQRLLAGESSFRAFVGRAWTDDTEFGLPTS